MVCSFRLTRLSDIGGAVACSPKNKSSVDAKVVSLLSSTFMGCVIIFLPSLLILALSLRLNYQDVWNQSPEADRNV